MTHRIERLKTAKRAYHDALRYISMIGKQERTTSRMIGRLHALECSTTVAYQDTDGAKNYHECKEFDVAFARIVKVHFDTLAQEALALLATDINDRAADARQEFLELFGEAMTEETDNA
jgi:hypothetical protein